MGMDAVSRLRGVYFLEHLTPEEFQALADMMDLRPFVAGDKILNQGEPTTNFYIVDSGHVNLRYTDKAGYEKPIGSKSEGDYFGIKMFTTQEVSEFTFEAVGQAHLWVVERQDWDALLEKFPNVLDHMPELRVEYAKLTRGLDWLAPGEVVDIFTRQHWWALALSLRLPVLLAALFTGAFLLSLNFGVVAALPWVGFVYGAALVVALVLTAWNAATWFNHKYIVTNKRAIRITEVLFISDSREELGIEKIQSQQVERGGPISVFLNISDLRLTSASSGAGGLVFEKVGNVERIQEAINNEKAKVVERRGAAERERLRNQIANEIRHYVFQQPNPLERPKPKPKPLSLGGRVRNVLQEMFGTEIRTDKIVTWRKHRIILLRQTGVYLVIFFALLALMIGISIYGSTSLLAQNGVYLALVLLMGIALGAAVWQWMDWQVDLYRLTETQIIDIESLPFGLRYTENRADLAKIQDVNAARPGFFYTLLNFGDVIARVAGNAEPFTFNDVARPSIVADEISERLAILKLRETERTMREQTRTVVDAIVAYHRLMMAERQEQAAAGAAAPALVLASASAAPADAAPQSDESAPDAETQSDNTDTDFDGDASESEFPSESDLFTL